MFDLVVGAPNRTTKENIFMENQETYNPLYVKFESCFEQIIYRLAQLQPNSFQPIDLEDFIMFFEEPCSKGKNKGLPRLQSIFDQYLKNSKMKFSDENYVANVCLALTYDDMKLANGLEIPIYRIMLNRYNESAHCKRTFVDYSTLENELYVNDSTSSLEGKNLLDILFRRVFEKGYLDKYFNGPDLTMLKVYLKPMRETGVKTNIKDFTNRYQDYRRLSSKAYDTRLRNIYKAYWAVLSVKFDIWDDIKNFKDNPFGSLQESIDFLNDLKPLKEKKEYFKQKLKKEAEAETETETETSATLEDPKIRYKTLKEYLVKKFGGSKIREVDGAFEVLTGKKWCLKYFLNGGYNNLKTGERGSWINSFSA